MMRPEDQPAATISIDVDPLDAHLAGYGVSGAPPDRLVYERAVPRILELLSACSMRATFFLVARDAASQAPRLREVIAAGHEVASHTVTHPEAWRHFGAERVAEELRVSRDQLRQACGRDVVGFRSPGWHSPVDLPRQLVAAGYRYDASSFPSPLLAAAGLLLWLRSGGKRWTALGAREWFAARAPHVPAGIAGLVEFPVSVTRALRLPIYHTLRERFDDPRFERTLDGFVREGHPLSYPLHAVDALGLRQDNVDRRLERHPGMGAPLAEKLGLLRRTLSAIRARFETATFQERAAATLGA
jgi:peptidoglycan/xylan/chitin deacetylase (PgdA/CDA1 family)